jgi:hypothetical protein
MTKWLNVFNSWGAERKVQVSNNSFPAQLQSGIPRKIVDFHMDESRDWVAELECGHQQHVRHDPPWTRRHWVTTPQGRLDHVGRELNCLACGPDVLGMSA